MKKNLYKVIVLGDYTEYLTQAYNAGEAEQKVKDYITKLRTEEVQKEISVLQKDGSINPDIFANTEQKPVTISSVYLMSGVIVK